ncbi:hypothetical protein COLO4_20134 [Corchorus olitorius]|uniref:Uncharacterized protein n=1 Tax=Corchorus olitorius TaxID=93759 RepID=A0A1R3J1G7_9ROSI|nr:hypothetical protein COLO4_20134 [Corchorus olitorius]
MGGFGRKPGRQSRRFERRGEEAVAEPEKQWIFQ